MYNKLTSNYKEILIFFLFICLGICLYIGRKPKPDDYEGKLEDLNRSNIILLTKNDSLGKVNRELDEKIITIIKEKDMLTNDVSVIKVELTKIKKERYEINQYVNRLSANGVADELSKYLDEKSKSKSNYSK